MSVNKSPEMEEMHDLADPLTPHDDPFDQKRLTPQATLFERVVTDLKHPKWLVLLLDCMMTFGSYYVFDFPGAFGTGPDGTIQSRFAEKGKDYTQSMNNALYSAYSYPNTVLAIFGGLLIDKYLGLRVSTIFFAILVFIGSLLFWVGVMTTSFPLLVFARLVYGCGAESLTVAQSTMSARWFDASQIALAFGINIALSRAGSSFNFLISPNLAKKSGVDAAALLGAIFCGVSLLLAVAMVMLDKRGVKKGLVPEESKDSPNVMRLSDFKKLSPQAWLLCVITMAIYIPIIPFISISENYMMVKYSIDSASAARVISLYQILCAALSPVGGALVDKIGYNALWIIASSVGLFLAHGLFLITELPAVILISFMGIIYAVMVSCIWPSLPLVVAPNVVGVGYGIMTALENLGMAFFPEISGKILDDYTPEAPHVNSTLANMTNATNHKAKPQLPSEHGYELVVILFMSVSVLSAVLGAVLACSDRRNGTGILMCGPDRKEELIAEQEAERDQDLAAE